MNTTIQDFPGRTGYWHIGVPPSGPMDSFAFRVANALVGNDEGAAGLEVTLSGAQHRHHLHGVPQKPLASVSNHAQEEVMRDYRRHWR